MGNVASTTSGHHLVAPATCRSQAGQRGIVTRCQHHAAIAVTQEVSTAQRHRAALRAADAQDRDLDACGQCRTCRRIGGRIGLVRDQHQHATAKLGLFDQLHAPGNGVGGVVPRHGHGVGRHGVQQVAEAVRVSRERGDHEGRARVADQRIQAVAIAIEQGVRLLPRSVEATWWHVA